MAAPLRVVDTSAWIEWLTGSTTCDSHLNGLSDVAFFPRAA